MLIAGNRNPDPPVPPNNAPEWTATPSPTFTETGGGTYDLKGDSTDQEQDTLTYTLNSGSNPLPSGVDLATNGVITANAGQISTGSSPGIIIDCSDGTDTTPSPSFTLEITSSVNALYGPYTHTSETVGTAWTPISGVWSVSDDGEQDVYIFMKIENTTPMYTGSGNYFYAKIESTGSAGNNTRAERRFGQAPEDTICSAIPGTGSGPTKSDPPFDLVAPQAFWYASWIRMEEANGPNNGYVIQWHNQSGAGNSPCLAIKASNAGMKMYQENLIDHNDVNGTILVEPADLFDAHRWAIKVLWDTRADSAGSTGYVEVYLDGGTSPVWSAYNRQTFHKGASNDNREIPFFKYGIYNASYNKDPQNGEILAVSYDNFITFDETATIADVWAGLGGP